MGKSRYLSHVGGMSLRVYSAVMIGVTPRPVNVEVHLGKTKF